MHIPQYCIVHKKGIFCVFEGIDGSGKTTLLKETLSRLLQAGVPEDSIVLLREPTESPSGKKIRECLSSASPPPPEVWLSLFIEDRKFNVQENILPALAAGKMILQDRYYYSTAAYQGSEEGILPEEIIQRNRKEGFPDPDLLFFLKIRPELSIKRIEENRSGRESFETLSQQKSIHANFLSVLPESCIMLDAEKPPEQSAEKAAEAILKFSKQKH